MTQAAALSDAERLDRLRLIRSENVGPVTFRRLLDRYGTATAALRALPELVRRGGQSSLRICPAGEAEAEMAAIETCKARLIVFGDEAYPAPLAMIEDAPASLAVIGEVGLLHRAAIAIVGSRNASLTGRRMAQDLARDLGLAGLVVVSGMARGIDAEAHRGALDSGTIAVLAGGVDVCYPRENEQLYARIGEEGAVISEAPPGTAPQARHFPRRNRIISGLSRGVVVVEANLRSGSLITARMAAEQGRDVFAVPGSPLDPRARGCNDLLRQGAVLTEGAADVLAQFRAPMRAIPAPVQPEPLPDSCDGEMDDARRLVAAALSPTPVLVDEIIRTCQLSPARVFTILLEWELAGRIERHAGNRVSLIG